MSAREIPKKPEVSDLSDKVTQLISQLCFRENSLEFPEVDLIFVFGTATCFNEVGRSLKKVVHSSSKIILTGGVEKYFDSVVHDEPESIMLFEAIKHLIPDGAEVIFETKSRNTYENLDLGLSLLKEKPKSLCFIAKSFHSGRAYLTLRKFLPHTVVYQDSFDSIYPNMDVYLRKEDWFKHPAYKARVWGEFLRIKKYGLRGDLILDEVKGLLSEIEDNL